MTDHFSSLIQAHQARDAYHKGAQIRFLDATFFLPDMGRDAVAEFTDAHLPQAIFFDLDEQSDPTSGLPHTLPAPDRIADNFARLGLNQTDWVICYDNSPFLSSARAWWMLRYIGHERVSILDGGLKQWRQAGGTIERGTPRSGPRGTLQVQQPRAQVATTAQITQWINEPHTRQIVDARPAARFSGATPEPRAGMRSGHMPTALNVPITELLDPETQCLKPIAAIEACFHAHAVDPTHAIATTCGSGVTACGLAFGLHLLGQNDVCMYDGSWSEWGRDTQDPKIYPVVSA